MLSPRLPDQSDSPDPRARIGLAGERHAREHLERLGFGVVAERARTRWGEIDLIVHDQTTLVFCEVKSRVVRSAATPWTSLHEGKQRQVRRLAAAWLASAPERPRCRDLRFDAISVLLDPGGRLVRLDHIAGAF